jgi:UDP-GlcNAc:undecaprenyl-phosphate GlcNAc-1-phosphate transferase
MTSTDNRFFNFFVSASIFLGLLTLCLTIYKYSALPYKIPLLYSHPWGAQQLTKRFLILAPCTFQLVTLAIAFRIKNTGSDAFFSKLVLGCAAFGNILANLAILRILDLTAFLKAWPGFLSPAVILPFVLAFAISFVLIPPTISLAKRLGMVDDPDLRKHPAMLQTRAIPRVGGLPIFLGFLIAVLLSVPFTKPVIGILLGSLVAVITGIWDDKTDLNPYKRFFVGNILAAGVVIVAGVGIAYFKIPFIDKVIDLGAINFKLGTHNITLLADAFLLIWIIWIMNMLNWSKGVDGQFPGIIIITSLVIGILALRIAPVDPTQLVLAKIAFAAAGATLAFLIFNWHPSKILPGYSTTFLGLTLATLSVYSGAKVAIAILVLLVPTLDALAAIMRRVLRGQSPFWHDKEHLHHRLLNRGLTHQQISYFYWGLTAICGTVALLTAGKQKLLAVLVLGGLTAFGLAALNLKGLLRKK